MMRMVVRKADVVAFAKTGKADGADTYKSRLIKYIPAEVVALYMMLVGVISAANGGSFLLWISFGVGVLGTYLYLLRVQKVTRQGQLFISVGAFIVWAFALVGPFDTIGLQNKDLYGSLLVPIYTFFIPIIEA